jgi:hypothetical protein
LASISPSLAISLCFSIVGSAMDLRLLIQADDWDRPYAPSSRGEKYRNWAFRALNCPLFG